MLLFLINSTVCSNTSKENTAAYNGTYLSKTDLPLVEVLQTWQLCSNGCELFVHVVLVLLFIAIYLTRSLCLSSRSLELRVIPATCASHPPRTQWKLVGSQGSEAMQRIFRVEGTITKKWNRDEHMHIYSLSMCVCVCV